MNDLENHLRRVLHNGEDTGRPVQESWQEHQRLISRRLRPQLRPGLIISLTAAAVIAIVLGATIFFRPDSQTGPATQPVPATGQSTSTVTEDQSTTQVPQTSGTTSAPQDGIDPVPSSAPIPATDTSDAIVGSGPADSTPSTDAETSIHISSELSCYTPIETAYQNSSVQVPNLNRPDETTVAWIAFDCAGSPGVAPTGRLLYGFGSLPTGTSTSQDWLEFGYSQPNYALPYLTVTSVADDAGDLSTNVICAFTPETSSAVISFTNGSTITLGSSEPLLQLRDGWKGMIINELPHNLALAVTTYDAKGNQLAQQPVRGQ